MDTTPAAHFDRQYQLHLKHLKLKGLQPKTIDAYARAIRRIGGYFSQDIDALSEEQLTDYFSDLIGTHSWSAVKLDLYGLKFYTTHVLRKPSGHAPSYQATQGPALARHRHGRRSASPVCRHPHPELSGVLLHTVQLGLASGRRTGAQSQ